MSSLTSPPSPPLASGTEPPPPKLRETRPPASSWGARLAPLFLLGSLVALVMAIVSRESPPTPEQIARDFLIALQANDVVTLRRWMTPELLQELPALLQLQERKSSETSPAPSAIKVTVRKVTASRAFVDAILTRDNESLPIEVVLHSDRETGWKVHEIRNQPTLKSGERLEVPPTPETESTDSERKSLQEELIRELNRKGEVPLEVTP